MASRDRHMAELLVRLRNVLGSLARQRDKHYGTEFRLRDFAVFCLKVAHDEGWGDEMHRYLDAVVADQTGTAVSSSSLFNLLRLVLGMNAERVRRKEYRASASQLRIDLKRVADKLQMDLVWKTPESLAQAIKREPTLYSDLGLARRENTTRKTFDYVFEPTAEQLRLAITEWKKFPDPYTIEDAPELDELQPVAVH
jgi:hypothetical protein